MTPLHSNESHTGDPDKTPPPGNERDDAPATPTDEPPPIPVRDPPTDERPRPPLTVAF